MLRPLQPRLLLRYRFYHWCSSSLFHFLGGYERRTLRLLHAFLHKKKKRETCNIKYRRRKEIDRQAGSRAGIRRVIGFPACWTRHPSLTQSLCSSTLLFFVCVSLSLASLHVYMCCPSIARGSDSGSLIPAEEMTAGECRKKDTEWKGL